jgi:thioredoxin-like negative regulator of GroEL
MKFSLANSYYRAGLRSKSQEIYEKLLVEKQLMPEACANLAMIHLEAGRADRAQAILEAGLSKAPDAESLFSPYALALAISGNPFKAVPWMVKAAEAEPGDSNHLYNLAGMYALTGRPQDALRTLDAAVDKGYAKADKMAGDPVFSSIRGLPEFSKILSRIQ